MSYLTTYNIHHIVSVDSNNRKAEGSTAESATVAETAYIDNEDSNNLEVKKNS